MRRHGPSDAPPALQPAHVVLSAIHALYHGNEFIGSCVAVTPRVIISAGHHFDANKDDVADFSIRTGPPGEKVNSVRVEYASKNVALDLLVLWVSENVPWTKLRGLLPPVDARVATVWLSSESPHPHVISPGDVVLSDPVSSLVRGTVSMAGSSGAPVVDAYGDHVVGLHLLSNTRDGSRVSGFLSARKVVALLAEMGVNLREGDPPA